MLKPKVYVPLLITVLLVAVAQAQWGGATTPLYYNLTVQILDSRALVDWTKQFTPYVICNPWDKSLAAYPAYAFAAGKNFTLIIREIPYPNGTYVYEKYGLHDINITAQANGCGFVTFSLEIPRTVDIKDIKEKKAYGWYVAIVLNNWPEAGRNFLIYSFVNKSTNSRQGAASLEELFYVLGGNPAAPLQRRNVALTEWGLWVAYDGKYTVSCKDALTGEEREVTGPFARIYSSVIHVYFLGLLGNPAKFVYNQFTGYETLVVAGRSYTWQIDAHKGATEYAQMINPGWPYIVSVLGWDSKAGVVRPFIYLASYVTDLRYYNPDLRIPVVRYDERQVTLKTRVDITLAAYSGTIIEALNDKWGRVVINKTDINLPSFVVKTVKAPVLFLVGNTSQWATLELDGSSSAPLSCGLVNWLIPQQVIQIDMLLDVKGNPILTPSAFVFKIQQKLGPNQWITIDKAYGAWKTGIFNLVDALKTACREAGVEPIASFYDLKRCYYNMDSAAFKKAIQKLLEPVQLTRITGTLQLRNDEQPQINATGAVTSKLVVEYSYSRENIGISTVVLEMPLKNTMGSFVEIPELYVSILPVKIPLWKWGNATLPLADIGYRYTDADEVAGLRFVVESDSGFYLDYTGDKVVSVDPWSGQLVWTLPPYEFVAGLIGVRGSALLLVNASGYLALPALIALYENGAVRYLTSQQALSSDLYKIYEFATRTTVSYKFRVYQNDIQIGVANALARYPAAIHPSLHEILLLTDVTYKIYITYGSVTYNGVTIPAGSWIYINDTVIYPDNSKIWLQGVFNYVNNLVLNGRIPANIYVLSPQDRIYDNDTVIVKGRKETIRGIFRIVKNMLDKKLFGADYSGSSNEDLSMQAYVVAFSAGPGRIYDVEHTVHVAIFRVLQNLLIRDWCGNVVTGLPAGKAYLDIYIPVTASDGRVVNITLTRVPILSEVPVRLSIPVDDWGIPLVSFTGGRLEAYVKLKYFGYDLEASGSPGQKAPVYIYLYKLQQPAAKPVAYLPITPMVFRVWSSAVYMNVDPRKDVLLGFVVSAMGKDGTEIARGISRKDGQALLPNIPIGVNITLKVRTINPASDKKYVYTYEQDAFKSSYARYLETMGYDTKVLPWPDVYTLGTRGVVDSGRVVFNGVIYVDPKYACAKEPYDVEVEVFDLVIRLLDKTGKYLLSSQYVYLGPYPGATTPIPLNVTLVIDGDVWPQATMWRPGGADVGDHIVLTDFRVVGITGMRPIYERLADYYLRKAKAYAGCPASEPQTGNIAKLQEAYANVTNALAYAAMAGWLANFSTASPAAVFTITSNQPKELPYICDLTVKTVGAGEIARLFMKGQRFRIIVWYMGYKVFDDYVTITGPVINITTDVVPVTINAVSKSGETAVNALVGYTFTDAFVGHFVASGYDTYLANFTSVEQLLKPFDDFYRYTRSLHLPLKWRLDDYASVLNFVNPNYRDQWNSRTVGPVIRWFGWYRPYGVGSDFVYLPNAVVLRNASEPLYMAAVGQTTRGTVEKVCYNVTERVQKYVPTNNVTFGFKTSGLHVSWGGAARYEVIISAVGPAHAPIAAVYNETMFKGEFVGNYSITIYAGPVRFDNGTLLGSLVYTAVFNGSISLSIVVKRGVIDYTIGDGSYSFVVVPADLDNAIDVYTRVNAYSIALKTVDETTTKCVNVTRRAREAAEYIMSFDRWLTVSKYGWYYFTVDVFERTMRGPNFYGFFPLLTEDGACKEVRYIGPHREPLDTQYIYQLELTGSDVLNYRTLSITLDKWKDGGKVTVRIKAYNKTDRLSLIDEIEYNVTAILAGTTDKKYVTVRLPLLFGKVAERIFDIVQKGQTIRFDINVTIATREIDAQPSSVLACKLVPLYTTYVKVSKYDCSLPGRPPLDPTMVVSVMDLEKDPANKAIFEDTWGAVGFGTPITYVVKSGEVALLPAWYSKTAAAGSRIARIWIINASSAPSQGPALGTEFKEVVWQDPKVTVRGYKLKSYLVINYVPNVCPAGYYVSSTNLDEFDGSGYIEALGFGTGGTSSLVIGQYLGVAAWNSSALFAKGGVYKLPTVALDYVTVENLADYPIYINDVRIRYVAPTGDRYTYRVPVDDVMKYRVNSGDTVTAKLAGYGFGRTYMMNLSNVWGFRVLDPGYRYTISAFHGGVVDALKYFGLGLEGKRLGDLLSPIVVPYVPLNTLYASYLDPDASQKKRVLQRFAIFYGKRSEYTKGIWEDLNVAVTDKDFKYVFNIPSLPLKEIRDWNDRPLANQTVALFDRSGKLYAVVYSDNKGRLVYSLPGLSAMRLSDVVRVSWYNGYLLELLRGNPAFTIWIYDQATERDAVELGNATTDSKIRTYVYPVTVTVKDSAGRPLTGMYVKVVDAQTQGQLLYAVNATGSDGSAQIVDLRISKYPTGILSQVPATDIYYYVYDTNGALVASGKQSLLRGASVPATGWNIVATVTYVSEIPVKNSATRGYVVVKGVEFLNGTKKDVAIPFVISGGIMSLQGKIPVSVPYPVEIYVTNVTLGGQDVPVKGGKLLVFSGKTTDLLSGLDFAELGLTGIVTIQAVDASGTPRSDWTVQVLYGNLTAAQGAGQLQTVLPRTDVLDKSYTVRVITNAYTPEGKPLVKEQPLELRQKALSLQIPIRTVRAVVQVVDGFGNVRNDWSVAILNVASGSGQIATELVEGERYVVRATGLGFTNTTQITAKGPQMVIRVMIPTGKIVASVVDGFGNVRSDWPIEIVGVTAGQGKIGEIDVIAGQYTVRTKVFDKEFASTVNVGVGKVATVTLQVPTAKLSITAVDDDKKPIDNYVSEVQVAGPLNMAFSTPPKNLEVLAGTYNVKVSALGKDATTQVTVNAGETKNVQVVVPGTAGLDLFGTRIPLPTLVLYGLLLLVVVLILAIIVIEYNNWRRRRLMQILAPPK